MAVFVVGGVVAVIVYSGAGMAVAFGDVGAPSGVVIAVCVAATDVDVADGVSAGFGGGYVVGTFGVGGANGVVYVVVVAVIVVASVADVGVGDVGRVGGMCVVVGGDIGGGAAVAGVVVRAAGVVVGVFGINGDVGIAAIGAVWWCCC